MDRTLFDKYKDKYNLLKENNKKTSERSLLLEEMLSIVNEERKQTKYPLMNIKLFCIKLAHIPTKDLYYIKSVGCDYKRRNGSFSKYLFGSLKVKK